MPKETCQGHSPKSESVPPTIRLTLFLHKYLSELPFASGLSYDLTFSQGLVPQDTAFVVVVVVVVVVVAVVVSTDVIAVVAFGGCFPGKLGAVTV